MMASSNSIQGGRSGWGLAPGRRWEGMRAGIVVGLLVLSACSGSSKYFHDAVNEATQEMVGKRYGSPHKTQAATGGEKSGPISNAAAERQASVVKCGEAAAGPMS